MDAAYAYPVDTHDTTYRNDILQSPSGILIEDSDGLPIGVCDEARPVTLEGGLRYAFCTDIPHEVRRDFIRRIDRPPVFDSALSTTRPSLGRTLLISGRFIAAAYGLYLLCR
jgi:hypothetical protein